MKRLAYAAALFGGAAALAGSPYAAHRGTVDVAELARAVAHEDDHVTAIELAEWIKDRRQNLRVVDVRTPDEFEAFHIPTAERIGIDSLTSANLGRRDVIVLYSEGGAHAAQAWVFLRALGYEKVYFLRGGLYEWLEQVMTPALASNASARDSAEWARTSAISRYFGGQPRVGAIPDEAVALPGGGARAAAMAAKLAKIRRRGC